MQVKITELLKKLNDLASSRQVYRSTIFFDLPVLTGTLSAKYNSDLKPKKQEKLHKLFAERVGKDSEALYHNYLICNAVSILEKQCEKQLKRMRKSKIKSRKSRPKVIDESSDIQEQSPLRIFCVKLKEINSPFYDTVNVEKELLDYLGNNQEKILSDITNIISDAQKTEELYSKLFALLNNQSKNLSSLDWTHQELSIDPILIGELDGLRQKNKANFAILSAENIFTKLISAYEALSELVDNERTFIAVCQSIEVEKFQDACVNYYNKIAGEIHQESRDAVKTGVITRALNLIKKFKEVTNYFLLNFADALEAATDISKFIVKIFYIFANRNFSNFYKVDLIDLANAYQKLMPILGEINSAIKEGKYNPSPEDKSIFSTTGDLISTPFQRLPRYKLTVIEAVKSIPTLIESNIEFEAKSISLSQNGEEKINLSLSKIVSSIVEILERRTKFANEKIVTSDVIHNQKAKNKILVLELNVQSASEKLAWIKNKILRHDQPPDTKWKIRGFGVLFQDHDGKEYTVTPHMAEILDLMFPPPHKGKPSQQDPEELLDAVIKLGQKARDFRPCCLNFFYKRHPEVQDLFDVIAAMSPSRGSPKAEPKASNEQIKKSSLGKKG